VAEDRRLHLAGLRPGVDAELLGQQVTQPPVGRERLPLPPVAVQREHELGPPPLAQRFRCDQPLAVRDGLVVAARGQYGVDAVLGDRRAQLVEPRRLRPREVPVGELRDRRPAPQRQHRVEPGDRRCVRTPAAALLASATNDSATRTSVADPASR